MGRKLNGCRSGPMCACGALAGEMAGRVREVPVPRALAAPQDAPQFRRRITGLDQLWNQQ